MVTVLGESKVQASRLTILMFVVVGMSGLASWKQQYIKIAGVGSNTSRDGEIFQNVDHNCE